jgi:hypothetical protein
MKLVWHFSKEFLETEWIRDLFSEVVDSEVVDLDLKCFDDFTIHAISSKISSAASYGEYFRTCRARCSQILLIHISDEWFSGGYDIYQYFDGVVRIYGSYLTTWSGILTIPLGYTNDTRHPSVIRPTSQRKYAWSFTGEIKASRQAMMQAFKTFSPSFSLPTASIDVPGGKISKSKFDEILEDSVFSPCPMGNVLADTWRLYESLELGCIPLIERRLTLDYFTTLFGSHPLPVFKSWTDARDFAEHLFCHKDDLALKQLTIATWWRDYKTMLRANIKDLAATSHSLQLRQFGTFKRNQHRLLHEPLRLIELLRHQTVSTLALRLSRPVGPFKRIMREAR